MLAWCRAFSVLKNQTLYLPKLMLMLCSARGSWWIRNRDTRNAWRNRHLRNLGLGHCFTSSGVLQRKIRHHQCFNLWRWCAGYTLPTAANSLRMFGSSGSHVRTDTVWGRIKVFGWACSYPWYGGTHQPRPIYHSHHHVGALLRNESSVGFWDLRSPAWVHPWNGKECIERRLEKESDRVAWTEVLLERSPRLWSPPWQLWLPISVFGMMYAKGISNWNFG